MSEEDEDLEVVANSRAAYGTGPHEHAALTRMLENWHAEFKAEEMITTYRVRGLMEVYPGGLRAEEMVSKNVYMVDGDDLKEAKDAVDRVELLVDSLLADVEEVEE